MSIEKKPNNPPAFPRPRGEGGGVYNEGHEGMTLRDYFAAKVLPSVYDEEMRSLRSGAQWKPNWKDDVAKQSYSIADAMLKAREQ